MGSTVLSVLHTYKSVRQYQYYIHLQIHKLSQMGKYGVQGHMASKWQTQDSNPARLDHALILLLFCKKKDVLKSENLMVFQLIIGNF